MWEEKKLQMDKRGLSEAGECPKMKSDKFSKIAINDYVDTNK